MTSPRNPPDGHPTARALGSLQCQYWHCTPLGCDCQRAGGGITIRTATAMAGLDPQLCHRRHFTLVSWDCSRLSASLAPPLRTTPKVAAGCKANSKTRVAPDREMGSRPPNGFSGGSALALGRGGWRPRRVGGHRGAHRPDGAPPMTGDRPPARGQRGLRRRRQDQRC